MACCGSFCAPDPGQDSCQDEVLSLLKEEVQIKLKSTNKSQKIQKVWITLTEQHRLSIWSLKRLFENMLYLHNYISKL